ncbi:MAG: ABC transporter ATP-binding protein [Xanthobacteraceae bacterium]
MTDVTAGSTEDYSTGTLVRRLLVDEALDYWPRYAIAFVLMGVAAAATALTAYLLGTMTNEAYVNHNFHGIVVIGVIAMGIFAAKGFTTYGSAVILSWIGNSIIANNQRRLFDKLLHENIGFFADRHSSEFIARLTTGAAAVSQVINLLITAIGRDLMSLIGLTIVMLVQDPIMALGGFIGAPPAFYFLRKLIRRVRGIARMQFNGGTRIIETMQEALQGMRMVKAFALEDEMQRRLEKSVAEVQHESNKMARVANRASPIMEMLGGFTVALATIYGGYRVIETGATPGEFVSFMAAFLLAYEPAKRLARLNIDLNNNLVGVRVLYEVIDSPPGEPNDDDLPPLKLATARVEFADVDFAYRADTPVLRGMNLVAQPGKVTALVGPSGGGKSTVLNLLLRFYEVDSGRVLIDGQNIAAVSRRSLRQEIAYVGQIVHLFRGTIRENIALGKLTASEAEIVAAAKAAHAHDFIMSFPAGYDTPVGEHGLQLSGGQRQRVAIARALVKNSPIILLDEATASLDSESERHVQEALAELCKGRTTLVIAHRLSTIMHADCILVVENGIVVESGRHDELLRKGGRYASFYRLQLREQAPLPALEAVAAVAAVASAG